MSPWDMIPYFQAPVLFQPSNTGNPGQLVSFVPADPMRVLLVFTNNSAVGQWVVPAGLSQNNQAGIYLPGPSAPFVVNQAWFGSMVSVDWETLYGSTGGLLAYGVSMYKWPKGGGNQPDVSQALASLLQHGCTNGGRADNRPQPEALRPDDLVSGD